MFGMTHWNWSAAPWDRVFFKVAQEEGQCHMILTDRWNSRLHSFAYIHSNGKGFSLQKGQLRLLRGKLRLSDHMLHWKSWRSLRQLVDEDDDFLEASGPAVPAVAAADFFLSSQTAALRV